MNIIKRWINLLKKPIFAVIALLMAVICLVIYFVIPEYSYKQTDGKIQFNNPESFCTSNNGWKAITDDRKNIYCMNEKGSLIYALDKKQFKYENAEIIDIAFDSDNKLYCHIAVYNERAYLTDSEVICEIDNNGKIVREVIRYDYRKVDNPPSHKVRIMGLHFLGENLYYLYKEDNGISIMEMNPDNPQHSGKVFLSDEDYSEIMKCHSTPDGDFVVLKNNGEIGWVYLNGEYEVLYKATYDIRKDEGIFPYDVFMIDDKLYMLAGQEELTLYKWENGAFDMLIPIKKSVKLSEDTDLYNFGLGEYESKLTIHINESLYFLDEDNKLTPYCNGISLPVTIELCMCLKTFLLDIGIICLVIGVILGIGNLMKWRLSLLSKQMLSTIPIVFVMLCVVIAVMFISMINLSSENIIHETIAINEIAAAQFTGEELEIITGYESVDNGQVKDLSNRLRKFIDGNKSDWSRNYSISIFIRAKDEKFVCIANSDESNQFMVNNFSTDKPINENFYEKSNTFAADVSYGEEKNNLQLVLITPIYLENGEYNAVMLLNASQDSLTGELISAGKSLLLNIILLGTLLILVITLVANRNVKSLKNAKNVIAKIADDAVYAGIELYKAIVLNPNAEKDFGIPDVKVGIGIHSGMARIGIVGEEERMSGTVISNTVNLSSRMESLTKRYGAGIIISKDTLERMKNPDMLSTRYLGMVQVAGVKEVAGLYEVLECLGEEQRQKKEKTKLEFRQAIRLYHTGDLKQSLGIFNKLKEIDKEDKALGLYARYIEDMISKGNAEHNIFRFENK